MFNSTRLAPQLLYHHTKQFFLAPSALQPRLEEASSPLGWEANQLHHIGRQEVPNGEREVFAKGDLTIGWLYQVARISSATPSNFLPPRTHSRVLQKGSSTTLTNAFQTKVSDHHLPARFQDPHLLSSRDTMTNLPSW